MPTMIKRIDSTSAGADVFITATSKQINISFEEKRPSAAAIRAAMLIPHRYWPMWRDAGKLRLHTSKCVGNYLCNG